MLAREPFVKVKSCKYFLKRRQLFLDVCGEKKDNFSSFDLIMLEKGDNWFCFLGFSFYNFFSLTIEKVEKVEIKKTLFCFFITKFNQISSSNLATQSNIYHRCQFNSELFNFPPSFYVASVNSHFNQKLNVIMRPRFSHIMS